MNTVSSPNQRPSRFRVLAQTACGIALGAIAVYALSIWRSDERVLKRRLKDLATLIAKPADETPIATLNRLRKIGDHFAAEVQFVPGSGLPTTMGRQELLVFLQNVRSSLRELRVRIREQQVSFAADRQNATTHAVVEVHARSATDIAEEVREGIIEWRRTNNTWQIRALRASDTIRNPVLSGWDG